MHGSSGSCSSFSGEIQLGFTPLPHSKKLVANPGFSLPPRNSLPFGKDDAFRLTNISMTRTSFDWLTQETDFTFGWNIKHEWDMCGAKKFHFESILATDFPWSLPCLLFNYNSIPMPFSEYQTYVRRSCRVTWLESFDIWPSASSTMIRMCRYITMHHDM